MDRYTKLVESAKKHQYLYHYTKVDSLRKILKSQLLMLGRIDKVNDPKENGRIKALWGKRIFLLCLTHGQNNTDYFYKNYGDLRLNFEWNISIAKKKIYYLDSNGRLRKFKKYGRRSKLKHKTYHKWKDWCLFDITLADIDYTDDIDSCEYDDGFQENAGLIKSKEGKDKYGVNRDWSIEEETRIRATLRPVGPDYQYVPEKNTFSTPFPDFIHIYIRLPRIDSISISPYIDDDKRKTIIQLCDEYKIPIKPF